MRSYKNRLYTSNETGWPGCHHVRLPDDAHKLVSAALNEPGFSEEDCKPGKAPGSKKMLTVGFGHDIILSNADTVNSDCMILYILYIIIIDLQKN